MEEKNVALKLAFPIYGGGVPRPSNLPPTARRGEGDHEVVEGGRRLAVRTAMEHPIGALPRTPFPASRDFAPVGSMSLDFQVASLSYKSSSFATSRGNEKIGGTGYCVTYDTDSQSRNADFILIARKGDTATLGAKGPVKLKNPWAEGPSILRTFPSQPFYTTRRRKAAITLGPEARQTSRPQGLSKGVSNHFFVLLEQGYIIR